jgi:dephospho-CoA kinase
LQPVHPGPGASESALIFGLTGGIASGKTTAALYFQELGAYIIDADRLGHELIEPGQPAYGEIVDSFGRAVIAPNGRIDRRKLGPIVFADPQKLRLLDAIVHPRIHARVQELAAERHSQNPQQVVILDAALIYEWGALDKLCKVIVAWCRPEQQVERLMGKTGISREEAQRRIQSQIPVEEKRRLANYQIDCSGTIEHSREQVKFIYAQLLQLVKTSKLRK